MKHRILFIAAVISVTALTVRAQDSDVRIGFGTSIGQNIFIDGSKSTMYMPLSFNTFTIPIFLTKNFRIEPALGILTYSRTAEYTDGMSVTSTSSQLRLGAGLHYVLRPIAGAADVSLYVGPHFAVTPLSSKSKSNQPNAIEYTRSQSNLIVGLQFGGEYWVGKQFTVGSEVQFNYLKIGEEETSPTSTSTYTISESYMNISTSITLRFYFN
jgi:hypothetical protein